MRQSFEPILVEDEGKDEGVIVESVAPLVEQPDQDAKNGQSLVDEFAKAVAQKLSGTA